MDTQVSRYISLKGVSRDRFHGLGKLQRISVFMFHLFVVKSVLYFSGSTGCGRVYVIAERLAWNSKFS